MAPLHHRRRRSVLVSVAAAAAVVAFGACDSEALVPDDSVGDNVDSNNMAPATDSRTTDPPTASNLSIPEP